MLLIGVAAVVLSATIVVVVLIAAVVYSCCWVLLFQLFTCLVWISCFSCTQQLLLCQSFNCCCCVLAVGWLLVDVKCYCCCCRHHWCPFGWNTLPCCLHVFDWVDTSCSIAAFSVIELSSWLLFQLRLSLVPLLFHYCWCCSCFSFDCRWCCCSLTIAGVALVSVDG